MRTCENCIHHDVCRYPLEYRANPETCWKYEEPRPHGEWIPCSERLPEKQGYYLVQTDGTHNDVIDIAEYSDWETGKPSWFKASKILAWMPLPEPYEKGETNG